MAGMRYLAASILIAAAGALYGLFSHGVYSYYMTYAFMVPLLGGAVPYLAAAVRDRGEHSVDDGEAASPGFAGAADIQLAVICTLTAGSILKGVLDIYGTSNRLLIAYPVIAVLIAVAALISGKVSFRRS